jgi:hypothetical protein
MNSEFRKYQIGERYSEVLLPSIARKKVKSFNRSIQLLRTGCLEGKHYSYHARHVSSMMKRIEWYVYLSQIHLDNHGFVKSIAS